MRANERYRAVSFLAAVGFAWAVGGLVGVASTPEPGQPEAAAAGAFPRPDGLQIRRAIPDGWARRHVVGAALATTTGVDLAWLDPTRATAARQAAPRRRAPQWDRLSFGAPGLPARTRAVPEPPRWALAASMGGAFGIFHWGRRRTRG